MIAWNAPSVTELMVLLNTIVIVTLEISIGITFGDTDINCLASYVIHLIASELFKPIDIE
jgi:hypothetical protein